MRLRMCDDDREKFGGPEWLDWAPTSEWLNDQPADVLIDLDDQLRPVLGDGRALMWLVAQVIAETSQMRDMRVIRAWAWLMWRAAGSTGKVADFTPRLFAVDLDRGDADADPPSGGEESSPTSTPDGQTASPESATSTNGSDPGSPSATPE